MAEQSTEAMQSRSDAFMAVVFQNGAMRIPVEVNVQDPCPVVTFPVRPWGEPRRCSECGRAVCVATPRSAGALGTVQCQRHTPRALLHGEPDDLHPPVMPWVPGAVVRAVPARIHANAVAIPVLDEPRTMSLRERLAAKRAAEGNQG